MKTVDKELRIFLEPIIKLGTSEDIETFFYDNGCDIKELTENFDQVVSSVTKASDMIENFESENFRPDNIDECVQILDDIRQLFTIVDSIDREIQYPDVNLVSNILKSLVFRYVRIKSPLLFDVLRFIKAFDFKDGPVLSKASKVIATNEQNPVLNLENIVYFGKSPIEFLKELYWPQGMATREQVNSGAKQFFHRVQSILSHFDFNSISGPPSATDDPGTIPLNGIMAISKHFLKEGSDDYLNVGATVGILPEDEGGGVFIVPFGELEVTLSGQKWDYSFKIINEFPGVVLKKDNFRLIGGSTVDEAEMQFKAATAPSKDPYLILGPSTATNLTIQSVDLFCSLLLKDSFQYAAEVMLHNSAIIIQSSDGDGFLQKILPKDPLTINFDLTIGYSNQKGFYIIGAAGFAFKFQVNKQLGPIFINTVDLSVFGDAEGINLTTAVTGGAQIGPLTAVVQEIGLKTQVIFGKTGLLGKADLDFGFKLPTAVGLSIQTSGLSGGGFLAIDPPNYRGMLQISYQDKFDITAFALITTKIDGKDAFSMFIQIMAKFTPVQLGLGFALVGVGGIFGFHRDLKINALKAVVKNHSLDKLLFPDNPVKDVVVILDAMQSIYPPKEDRHVLGFMGKFIWGGSVKLVEFNIAIVVPLGGRALIVIVGTAKSKMPSDEIALLKMKMDLFGVIDFANETLSVDLELYDSQFQKIDLSGQMALRACWAKSERNFAMSAGGWYPRYRHIPPNFPALKKMKGKLEKSGIRLSLSTYFALTSTTIQTGANFDLWGKKAGFTITGDAGFDCIIIFKPFSFEVVVYFRIRAKKGPVSAGVKLEFKLTGPNPYKANGYAKFKVTCKTFKVRFSKTFGSEVSDPLPIISPKRRLLDELANPKCVKFHLPRSISASFEFTPEAEGTLDPSADLIISQSVVPLKYTMERFGGGQPPAVEKRLFVDSGVDDKSFYEPFAPEQFNTWTKDEKLSAPPYEDLRGGLQFTGILLTSGNFDTWPARDIQFETVLRESDECPTNVAKEYKPISRLSLIDRNLLDDWSAFGGGLYHSPLISARQTNHPSFIDLQDERYVVATHNSVDGKFIKAQINGGVAQEMTFTEAMQLVAPTDDSNTIRNAVETV